MNHAGHDDAAMDHGGRGAMPDMCSMSMLFTWDTRNLCIVFRQWHIRTTPGLILSLAAVVLLAMGYEALRALSRAYEDGINQRLSVMPRRNRENASKRGHVVKAVLYGVQNFYAFMLM
ncbi:hypothetical protein EsHS_00007460 [Epichloe bromicola]